MRKGFARNLEEEAALKASGVKSVYVIGRGTETLDNLIKACRGERGELLLATDLRIFGSKRKEIMAAMDKIESAGLKVVDIREPKTSQSKLIDFALGKTAGDARSLSAGKTLKVAGKKGGKRKAEVQELRRAAVAHPDVVRRLCECDLIPWREKVRILGGKPFSTAGLRRMYLDKL